jgi:ribonuclease HI
MEKNKITIYTDGSARGNPGKAGWAGIILFHPHSTSSLSMERSKERVIEIGGYSPHATNNQMELTAAIKTLETLKNLKEKLKIDTNTNVEIFSDSKYVVLGITEWIFNWQKNNWISSTKKPVFNKELWEELFKISSEFKIKWSYVEGHNGDKYNDRADEIATNFADGNKIELRQIVNL